MKIFLDENVGLRLAADLRNGGHEVFAVAESAERGMRDDEIWSLACAGSSLLVTRDWHFTNAARYDPTHCLGVVFVRPGNLKASEEAGLVCSFLAGHALEEYEGRLVTLSRGTVRIR